MPEPANVMAKEAAPGYALCSRYVHIAKIAQVVMLVTANDCTFAQELGGLLRLRHGFVALCCPVPKEGRRHIALLHVHNGLGHCKSRIKRH